MKESDRQCLYILINKLLNKDCGKANRKQLLLLLENNMSELKTTDEDEKICSMTADIKNGFENLTAIHTASDDPAAFVNALLALYFDEKTGKKWQIAINLVLTIERSQSQPLTTENEMAL